MDSLLSLRRSALIYGLCLPLAILLGFVLARPASFTSLDRYCLDARYYESAVIDALASSVLLILSWNAVVDRSFSARPARLGMC